MAPNPSSRGLPSEIYLKVGMKESALAEFERAAQVAPQDDTIKDWIKRIKRGEV